MRWFLTFVVRRVKRDKTWTLDPMYTTGAFVAMLLSTAGKIMRGYVRRIGFRRARGLTLIGTRVTLHNKGYISVGRRCIIEDGAVIQGLSRQGINLDAPLRALAYHPSDHLQRCSSWRSHNQANTALHALAIRPRRLSCR